MNCKKCDWYHLYSGASCSAFEELPFQLAEFFSMLLHLQSVGAFYIWHFLFHAPFLFFFFFSLDHMHLQVMIVLFPPNGLAIDDHTWRWCRTWVSGLFGSVLWRCCFQCPTTKEELEEYCKFIGWWKGCLWTLLTLTFL